MAEFQDVIIQMKRMCDHFRPTCNGCPLYLKKGTNEFCGEQPKDIRSHPALVEAAVMRWAAEHPEPVYPAWRDWLRDLYGNPQMTMTDILESPIDPEIAQRLNIVPRRKRNGENQESQCHIR